MVKNIDPSGDSNPFDLVDFDGTLFFSANDGTNGYELWRSDGTSDGTTMVANLAAGPASSAASRLTVLKKSLFFVAKREGALSSHVQLYVYGEEVNFPWSLFLPANMKKSGNP